MALFTSFSLIRVLSVFHLTLGYLFITAPQVIADQNLVFLLGEAMKLPRTYSFDKASPVTALLGLVFVFLGLADFVAVSMNEIVAMEYWASQTPVRLLFFFAITGYTYVFKPDTSLASIRLKSSPGDQLKNGVVFSWGFLEVLVWFWIYITLREERKARGPTRVVSSRSS